MKYSLRAKNLFSTAGPLCPTEPKSTGVGDAISSTWRLSERMNRLVAVCAQASIPAPAQSSRASTDANGIGKALITA